MQKVIRLFIFIIVAFSLLSFLNPPKEKINWISIQQLNEQYYNNPKPILVDVYTDWCGWCKEMERTTYHNQKLVAFVNSHYYAVKLDAESPDSMVFNKRAFGFNARNKSNELAEFLLFSRMEFPTTVFMPSIDARPAPLSGYMKAKDMEAPLKYFADGIHLTQTFVEFNKLMKKEW